MQNCKYANLGEKKRKDAAGYFYRTQNVTTGLQKKSVKTSWN